ncbi:hypothetical protein GCM10017044_14070 [Kordiimonas sediminis]|uniref:Divergent polysaccharide deacetylase family protein n=1 Tax=Kordiimonas sediminis TaxID=1735581 RepID=A0A919AR39_9PROT|nr:divergent polysaccharide deacetylase family protein [Kordiimonas sediminis]GHF20400.1 hypothetical protein GCM10017044_14070 [Kordiimonas sediminis]
MRNSLNSVLIAWAISLILLFGGILAVEYSYDPDAYKEPIAAAGEVDTEGNQNTQAGNNTADISAPESPIKLDRNMAILEEAAYGLLPRQARTGMTPLEYYAAKHPADTNMPRIAILMTEMGMRARTTERAISSLPTAVGFAFSPYGRDLENWGIQSRQNGHESFLMIPMEPVNGSQNDAGPLALLTNKNARENIGLLKTSLGKMTGYVGVINHMGSKFTANTDSIRPILDEVKRRGLMFVDSRSSRYSRAATIAQSINLPVAINNGYIDEIPSEADILNSLTDLENRARTLGAALGLARPYPISMDTVSKWAETLEQKGFQLVPVTALADRQPVR